MSLLQHTDGRTELLHNKRVFCGPLISLRTMSVCMVSWTIHIWRWHKNTLLCILIFFFLFYFFAHFFLFFLLLLHFFFVLILILTDIAVLPPLSPLWFSFSLFVHIFLIPLFLLSLFYFSNLFSHFLHFFLPLPSRPTSSHLSIYYFRLSISPPCLPSSLSWPVQV